MNLKTIIENVIRRNKRILINKKIKIKIFKEDILVYSDSKWIEFIVNQIIINSIKYSKEKKALININFKKNTNNIMLFIEDGKIFNEITKDKKTRKEFFNNIIDVVTLLGDDLNNVI